MNTADSLAQSVLRITAQNAQGGTSFGSGAVLTTATILTARHVVDPDGLTLQGRQPDPRTVRLQGPALDGGLALMTVDQLRFPDDPAVDLALAIIQVPKAASAQNLCTLPTEAEPAVQVGDPLICYGCSRADGPIERDTLLIQSVHGHAGVFVCNKIVPHGFSGGPVFSGGLLVGVTYARHQIQGQTFVHTGYELRQLLTKQTIGELKQVSGRIHVLRRYPLGPAMSPNEMTARLGRIIDKCVTLYGPQRAIALIAQANQMRMECGPDNGDKSLIQLAFLPTPHFDLYGFWHQAFVMATCKSPRMLAALLLSLDEDAFTATEAAARDDVLLRLESIGRCMI